MCDCIKTIDEKLKENGQMLDATMFGKPSRAAVSLIRTDRWEIEKRRGKPTKMLARFCPFCGDKYGKPDAPQPHPPRRERPAEEIEMLSPLDPDYRPTRADQIAWRELIRQHRGLNVYQKVRILYNFGWRGKWLDLAKH